MTYSRPVIFLMLGFLTACGSSPSPVLPPVQLTTVENAFQITKRWSHRLGDGAAAGYLKLTPAIEDNHLYSVDRTGKVIAFDMQKENVLWTQELSIAISTPPALDDDLILIGSSDGDVVALQKSDGKVFWRAQVSSEVLAQPKATKDLVIVRCVNGALYALDRKDGKQRWLSEQTTPALTLRGTSAPVIANDIVLSAFDNGRLLALNLQSGKLLWQASIAVPRGRTDLERMVDIDADPVVIDDVVYAVSFQGRIAALQLGSGRIIWAREIDSYSGMAVDAYRIYLVDTQGQLWALDRFNGGTIWKQDALLRRGLTKPRLHKQYLIVGDFNGFLHWLRRDNGKLVARVKMNTFRYQDPDLDETEDLKFPDNNAILAIPVVSGDMVIATDRYGKTEAFDVSYP